jgi:hypothetical protein
MAKKPDITVKNKKKRIENIPNGRCGNTSRQKHHVKESRK